MKAMEGKKKQPAHDKKHHHDHVPSYLKNDANYSASTEDTLKK